MKTMELAKKYHDYVIKMRREFHKNPEASMQEYNTCKKIKEDCDNMSRHRIEVLVEEIVKK